MSNLEFDKYICKYSSVPDIGKVKFNNSPFTYDILEQAKDIMEGTLLTSPDCIFSIADSVQFRIMYNKVWSDDGQQIINKMSFCFKVNEKINPLLKDFVLTQRLRKIRKDKKSANSFTYWHFTWEVKTSFGDVCYSEDMRRSHSLEDQLVELSSDNDIIKYKRVKERASIEIDKDLGVEWILLNGILEVTFGCFRMYVSKESSKILYIGLAMGDSYIDCSSDTSTLSFSNRYLDPLYDLFMTKWYIANNCLFCDDDFKFLLKGVEDTIKELRKKRVKYLIAGKRFECSRWLEVD